MSKKKIKIKARKLEPSTGSQSTSPAQPKLPPKQKETPSLQPVNPGTLKKVGLIATILIIVVVGGILFANQLGKPKEVELVDISINPSTNEPSENVLSEGSLDFSEYNVETEIGKAGESILKVLTDLQFPAETLRQLQKINPELMENTEQFAGSTYHILLSNNQLKIPMFLVFELNDFQHYEIGLRDSLFIQKIEKPVDIKIQEDKGIIRESFATSILDQGLRHELITEMEKVLKWTVDFHHLNIGDRWKVIYEGKYIGNKQVGIGKIIALYFQTQKVGNYGFMMNSEAKTEYLSEDGRSMKKAFLKAPVSYARISSRFNLTRLHPVLQKIKPHLGTDYAAPEGTPVLAISDGQVTKADYTSGNGNYIKIHHDDTYDSQYLHLTGFADGIQKGSYVKQGQVIGYVGSTGLATGPHVCFRFWKNNKQVDFLKEKLPSPYIFPKEDIINFKPLRDSLMKALDEIQFY